MEKIVCKKTPNFEMTAVKGDGSDFKKVSLKDYKSEWLVMFFFPLDFFICPTEITGFSKEIAKFKDKMQKF